MHYSLGWGVCGELHAPAFYRNGKLLTAIQWRLVIFTEREDFDIAKNQTSKDQRMPGHFPVLAACTRDR